MHDVRWGRKEKDPSLPPKAGIENVEWRLKSFFLNAVCTCVFAAAAEMLPEGKHWKRTVHTVNYHHRTFVALDTTLPDITYQINYN